MSKSFIIVSSQVISGLDRGDNKCPNLGKPWLPGWIMPKGGTQGGCWRWGAFAQPGCCKARPSINSELDRKQQWPIITEFQDVSHGSLTTKQSLFYKWDQEAEAICPSFEELCSERSWAGKHDPSTLLYSVHGL